MPLMDGVPSRPECAGPAKVVATAIDTLARAVVPARSQLRRTSLLRHTVITAAHPSFRRKHESPCSALDPCFRRDHGGESWVPSGLLFGVVKAVGGSGLG